MFNKKERAKTLKQLNGIRRRLMKNALSTEVTNVFGIHFSEKLSKLNNTELKKVYDDVKKYGSLTVVNGNIYPVDYVKKFKIWFGKDTKQPMATGYKRAIKSPFLERDKTVEDTRKRRKEFNDYKKNGYTSRMKEILDGSNRDKKSLKKYNDLINKIENLPVSRFDKMIRDGKGIIDWDKLFSSDAFSYDNIDEIDIENEILESIENAYKNLFRKIKK